jgi:hypothetical protein
LGESQDAEFEEREVWDEWEEDENTVDVSYTPSPEPQSVKVEPPAEPEPPPRRIVEVVRKPQTTQQTGTLYSVSYRSEEEEKTAETPTDTGAQDLAATGDPIGGEGDRSTILSPKDVPSTGALPATSPADTIATASEQDDQLQEERIRVIIPPYHAPTSEVESVDESDFAEPHETDPGLEAPESTHEGGDEAEDWEGDSWELGWDEDAQEPLAPEPDYPDEADLVGDREVWDDWEDEDENNAPSSPNRPSN